MSVIRGLGLNCAIVIGLGLAIASGAAAKGQPKLALLKWQTLAVSPSTDKKPLPIDEKQPLLFTRIAPVNSFKSPADMDTGGNIIPKGAAIVRTANDPERYCEPMRRRKQPQIYCVADTNGDGILDVLYVIPTVSVAGSAATHYEFLIGTMRMYSGRPLRAPVPKESLVPDLEPTPLEVMFAKTGKTRFALCIFRYTGSSLIDGLGYAGFCGTEWDVKDEVLPIKFSANGGSIILSKSEEGQFQAKIASPAAGLNFPSKE